MKKASLPDFGRQLLLALDKKDELYRLSCPVCTEFFNMEHKKPMKVCADVVCQREHSVCEECMTAMINNKEEVGELQAVLKRQAGQIVPDQSKFEQVKQLESMNELLRKVAQQTKKSTEDESDQKIKEVVDRVSKELFHSRIDKQRNDFLIKQLRKTISRSSGQFESKLESLQKRQKQLNQREITINNLAKQAIEERIQLEKQIIQKDLTIKMLREENQRLKGKLREEQHIQQIVSAVKRRAITRERDNLRCEHGTVYRKFKLKPWKGHEFTDTFRECKPGYVIELRPERRAEIEHKSSRRAIFDMHTFSSDKQDDRFLYFEFVSVNPKVDSYRFGLGKKQAGEYKQIRYANVTLQVGSNQGEQKQSEVVIGCFVNLASGKLYMTSGNMTISEDLPANIDLKSFHVFIFFSSWDTRIKIM